MTSISDNALRPYTSGMIRHQETLSTILIYNEHTATIEVDGIADYLKLKTIVQPITPGGVNDNIPKKNSQGQDVKGYENVYNITLDDKKNYYGVFNNFSLITVQEATEQIVKTHINFGSKWNAFFFGEKPRVYSYTGLFLDTMDYPYFQEFSVAYDKYLSGRKAVENKIRTKLVYDGRIVDGYMLNLRTVTSSTQTQIKEFAFTMLVKDVQWIRTNIITSSVDNGKHEEYNALSNESRESRSSRGSGSSRGSTISILGSNVVPLLTISDTDSRNRKATTPIRTEFSSDPKLPTEIING